MGAWELLTSTTITSNTQSVTLSGFTTSKDDVLKLVVDGFTGSASSVQFQIRPDNTGNNRVSQRAFITSSITALRSTGSIAYNLYGRQGGQAYMEAYIKVSHFSGRVAGYSMCNTAYNGASSELVSYSFGMGNNNEFDNGITSLVINGNQSDSFRNPSRLYLYRLKDANLIADVTTNGSIIDIQNLDFQEGDTFFATIDGTSTSFGNINWTVNGETSGHFSRWKNMVGATIAGIRSTSSRVFWNNAAGIGESFVYFQIVNGQPVAKSMQIGTLNDTGNLTHSDGFHWYGPSAVSSITSLQFIPVAAFTGVRVRLYKLGGKE